MSCPKPKIMDEKLLAEKIDRITAEFFQNFGELNTEQLNWKPSPQVWSIAQNIEHLLLVNESYYPVIWKAFKNNDQLPFHARIEFVVRYIGKSLLAAAGPNNKRKVKTYKAWQPDTGIVGSDVLRRFIEQQASLKQLLKNSKILFEKGRLISSPVNSNIVYPLEMAFEVLVVHEERHLNQAKEVLLELKAR